MPALAWAEEPSEQAEWRKRVVLSAGQEIQGDYFAFGPHVEISGTVHCGHKARSWNGRLRLDLAARSSVVAHLPGLYGKRCDHDSGTAVDHAGVGVAVLVATPPVVFLCMATILGIPIGLMLAAMSVVTLYLGRVFVMLRLGQRLLRLVSDSSSAARTFVTGLVVYFILSLVPFVGGLIMAATIAAGLGAILITKKELVVRLRDEQVV